MSTSAGDLPVLETAPSLSIYSSGYGFEDKQKKQEDEEGEVLERTVTIGEAIEELDGVDFSFKKNSMALIAGHDGVEESLKGVLNLSVTNIEDKPVSLPMHVGKGLGMDNAGCAGADVSKNIELNSAIFHESGDVEEYHKILVNEHPCSALLLRKYAQLLQSKGNFHEAEEYYCRAILADPEDSESLMHYAKLIWEIHHDKDKALSYFTRAAEAAPHESNVLGAYASFLWEIDGEEDGTEGDQFQFEEKNHLLKVENSVSKEDIEPLSQSLPVAEGLGIDVANCTTDPADGAETEEYYSKMVDGYPNSPLFLRNYAQFLWKSKGDLQRAEEYYYRAILADPADEEVILRYARLVWELHHDHEKALYYFDRAIQAAPGNSNVLAAYASFLWETEENDTNDSKQDPMPASALHGAMNKQMLDTE